MAGEDLAHSYGAKTLEGVIRLFIVIILSTLLFLPYYRSLCRYCDKEMPENPSEELIERGLNIRKRAYPVLQESPFALSASVMVTVAYCMRHDHEVHAAAQAAVKGWPLLIDFADFAARVLSNEMLRMMDNFVSDPRKSKLYTNMLEKVMKPENKEIFFTAKAEMWRVQEFGAG
jgi:hypothetical protein